MWRGKSFTEDEESGLPASKSRLDIVLEKSAGSTRPYANVKSASRIMKRMTATATDPVNEASP